MPGLNFANDIPKWIKVIPMTKRGQVHMPLTKDFVEFSLIESTSCGRMKKTRRSRYKQCT